jgi:hypothetical protein
MNHKLKLLALFLVAAFFAFPEPAQAGGSLTVTGRWAGSAFANPAFDFNNDGIFARTFDVKTYDQLLFAGMEGVADTGLVSVGTCGSANSFELQAFGKITFRGRFGDALYAEVDPTTPNLCFEPANPNEVATFRFVGGTGIYLHATGTATMTFHDFARIEQPVTLPGFPFLIPAPLMIDSHGEFVMHINL